jgi:hypothetical protein
MTPDACAALVGFEAHAAILDSRFAFQDMPMWPFARWPIFACAADQTLGLQPFQGPGVGTSIGEKLDYAFKAWAHRPLRDLRRFDILVFGSAASVAVERAGRWLGRVNDDLVNQYPEHTLLVEESWQRRFRWPRGVRNIRLHDQFAIDAAIRSRLSGSSSRDAARVSTLVAYLEESFPIRLDPGFYRRLEQRLIRIGARLPHYHRSYAELFSRTRPGIVFLEDASYGGQSYILKWARDLGIRTGEFQHGALMRNHAAYNYGAAGFDPGYAAHLPEFLLTYGRFWNEQTRTPSATVILGSPLLSARLAEHRSSGSSPAVAGNRLLVISQGDVTAAFVKLTLDLARLAPDLAIVYRLHPGEVSFPERFRDLAGLRNVTVDSSGDIYRWITECRFVVGASSTALYEAVGFGKPVYVLDTPSARFYTPRHLGKWFADAAELLVLLADPAPGDAPAGDDVWAPDWQGNYRRFLEQEVGLVLPPAAAD